jgi:NAD-dependent dihydropyrimidine dehydrogenase PreA subunit
MTAMFINVNVAPEVAADPELARKLVEVCPVGIFHLDEEKGLRLEDKNLDECVLCDLCTEAAPKGSVEVVRLYE